MKKAILGRKLGMTQIFTDAGQVVPVTVVEAGPCPVVQKKTVETDGYNAIQVGFIPRSEKGTNKPLKGHFQKAGVKPLRYLKELRLDDVKDYAVGQEITVDIFENGEHVDVSGLTKGKGFAGGIKRWGFHRGPMSHGSKYHRAPGSLSARMSGGGGKVFKGRRMPGRLGAERVTVQNLEVVRVDKDRNLLLVKGAIPGPKGGLVVIKNTVKAR